ncbi:hypothetical protein CC80DRAFT_542544 [Byssothecium circinans]|uniref:Uncharacterized protein n=1 Tax=Byssothecium circinans TaxID=147558 RepID=A0A6A5UBD4_9PLEO|nr:hypothetical protein CC80DRAFT_542544 [Byssothecium circinans]
MASDARAATMEVAWGSEAFVHWGSPLSRADPPATVQGGARHLPYAADAGAWGASELAPSNEVAMLLSSAVEGKDGRRHNSSSLIAIITEPTQVVALIDGAHAVAESPCTSSVLRAAASNGDGDWDGDGDAGMHYSAIPPMKLAPVRVASVSGEEMETCMEVTLSLEARQLMGRPEARPAAHDQHPASPFGRQVWGNRAYGPCRAVSDDAPLARLPSLDAWTAGLSICSAARAPFALAWPLLVADSLRMSGRLKMPAACADAGEAYGGPKYSKYFKYFILPLVPIRSSAVVQQQQLGHRYGVGLGQHLTSVPKRERKSPSLGWYRIIASANDDGPQPQAQVRLRKNGAKLSGRCSTSLRLTWRAATHLMVSRDRP